MLPVLKELLTEAGIHDNWNAADWYSISPAQLEKFAELIVKKSADAADMAYDARCIYPGDYVVEQLGYEQAVRHDWAST
jgi:hypothetical protein